MEAIMFFDGGITVQPHTATDAELCGEPINLRDFSEGERISLYETESGEMMCRTPSGRFIEGPEVDPIQTVTLEKDLDEGSFRFTQGPLSEESVGCKVWFPLADGQALMEAAYKALSANQLADDIVKIVTLPESGTYTTEAYRLTFINN